MMTDEEEVKKDAMARIDISSNGDDGKNNFEKIKNMINVKQGNSIEFLKELESNSIDLLVTDPPYKIITGGDSNGKNSVRPKGVLSGNRELMKFIPKFDEWLPECFRVLKDGTHAYIMINSTNFLEIANAIEKVGFKIHNILVWRKNNCTPSQFYMKNCEYIIFCRKGKAKYINNMGNSKTIHDFNNIIGNKVHPTEKPVELMRFYIENSSKENDIVLDPFMGSGSTGVACLKSNRKFVGFEIDENYYQIATDRFYCEKKRNTGEEKDFTQCSLFGGA